MPEFPEIFVSDSSRKVAVSKGVKAGKLRALGNRVYTTNLKEEPDLLVRRNIWLIVSLLFPDAIIADRTAVFLRTGLPMLTTLSAPFQLFPTLHRWRNCRQILTHSWR